MMSVVHDVDCISLERFRRRTLRSTTGFSQREKHHQPQRGKFYF
jgi:hypothetical protein